MGKGYSYDEIVKRNLAEKSKPKKKSINKKTETKKETEEKPEE
tara:strand:- start:865 stop:993 length:129 start_codon:yes stop_codon:yes gene_type:complete